jgi:hypothetical protein
MKAAIIAGCVALSVLSASSAHAREWQGNMPKLVGKLPPYPPVVCVTPNWTPEPCESRQPSHADAFEEVGKALGEFFKWLEWTKTNWLGTILVDYRPWNGEWPKPSPQVYTTILYDEFGGYLHFHEEHFRKLAESGDNVEVRGQCASSCTMILAYIPKEQLCFSGAAILKFHLPQTDNREEALRVGRYMLNHYPQDIRLWLRAKGGVEQMPHKEGWWDLYATDLWTMGYRKCEPGIPAMLRPTEHWNRK